MSTQVLPRLNAPNMSPPHPPRRFLPQPVETSTKSRRRNAPEAWGVISRSNKGPTAYVDPAGNNVSGDKRFSPVPVQTTSQCNRKEAVFECLQAPDPSKIPDPSPVRRLPQPVETTTTSSRRKKFSPQLIETTKRSRKAGDVGLALLPTEKTEIVVERKGLPLPLFNVPRPGALTRASVNAPFSNADRVLEPPESRFSSAHLSRNSARKHSFRVPDLAPIESQPDSEASEGSDCPSLSTSPSTASHDTELHKQASRVRESCDERFSGYLLGLAAMAAEKQLRDQAMAAYPNEKQHEHVDHFAIDKESDSSDETDDDIDIALLPHERGNIQTMKKQSVAEIDWRTKELQTRPEKPAWQAHEQSSMENTEFIRPISATGPFQRLPQLTKQAGHAADGLDRMRSAASPPMLGNDIKLPWCESPRHTRFEVDQYPGHYRGSGVSTPRQRSGLWTPGAGNSRHSSGKGLWMGVCAISDNAGLAPPRPGRPGLITPAEHEYPFAEPDVIMHYSQHLPESPLNSHPGSNMACIDDMLMAEQEIQRECTDALVTQVYNYLSLGYPALARKFDDELCKITRISVEELRRDDKLANTKGFIGTPEGKGVTQDGVSDGQCARWRALRLYVREWARQKPQMAAVPDLDAWGDRARRGSWAI